MRIRTLLTIFFGLILILSASSQTIVTVGTAASTTSTSGLANNTTAGDRNDRHMCIYSVAELTAAGLTSGSSLMSIAWEKTGAALYYHQNLTIRIWLKHNAATTFPASPDFVTETSAATLVYQTTTGTVPAAAGWLTFNFNTTTPYFNWNGTQNLQVITEFIRATDWTETGFSWRTITTLTNAAANSNGPISAPVSPLTRTGTRPQIRLGIPTTGNDAALVGMPSPQSAPSGTQNIDVQLRNTGTTTLTSANINWTIDGGAPTLYAWSGSLVPGAIATVTAGSSSFSGGPHTIQAIVSDPNGSPDIDPSNNTVNKSVLICSPLVGAYTIDKNSPTSGTNYNSFTDFSTALSNCGVGGNVTATVVSGSGPYSEQVIFQNIPGIGAGATVTIEGNGESISSAAAITPATNPNRHIIRLIGLQYFNINNVQVDMFPGSSAFIGIHILNAGNHITISNCEINMTVTGSSLLAGIVANSDPSGNLFPGGTFDFLNITGNTITGGGFGAAINGLASPLATNVEIANNSIYSFNSNGVYLRETNGAIVRDNQIDKVLPSGTTSNGIQLAQNLNINGRIYNNYIRMQATTGNFTGIYLFNGTGHKVYNNVIHDIRSTTGDIEAIRVRTGGTAPEIYFNTISLDNSTATTGDLWGFREELGNTNSILRNNIFSITQSTSGTKTALQLATTSNIFTAISSDYNDFWVPGGYTCIKLQPSPTPTLFLTTLNDWQTASTQDANSFQVDPLFQSAALVIPQSAVINGQGVTIAGITTDILGTTRSNPPDPGAYEFVPPAGDAGITDFIVPAAPFCASTMDVQFELTNAGGDPLNTVTINWTVNGVPQPVVNWAGPTLASGASTIVTLGNIPIASNTLYTFSATSSGPNGGIDINPANDNFVYNGFRKGMEGAYTINSGAAASATNFQSFQSFSDELSQYGVCTAVTGTVQNGPYTEQVVFFAIPGTSPVNTVTLNGNGQLLQFNPTVAADDHILQLNGVNHMIVENLTVNSLHPTQGRGIHITNGASKIAIRDNTVNVSLTNDMSSSFGIIISGENWLLNGSLSDSVVISGNTVRGGYSAIQLSGEHWTQPLTRITVSNNTALDWYGFGIYLSYTNGCQVTGNTIRRPTRTNSGSDAVTPAGITIPAGSLLFKLDKNRIYDTELNMPGTPTITRGIYLSGTSIAPTSGTIQNNLIYGMNNTYSQYGIQNNSVNGPINIYHNTIEISGSNSISNTRSAAINMSNFSSQFNTSIQNNVFVVTRGGAGAVRVMDVTTASSVYTSNYNVTWLNSSGSNVAFGEAGATIYNTFADWQTGTGKDLNSIHTNPSFVNPATGNFTPTNPFADGAFMGTSSVGVPDDILGTVRAANPDAGAFEFSPPPCTGAVGGTASAVTSAFCTSGSTSLSATGFSTGTGSAYQWQYSIDNFIVDVHDLVGQTNPLGANTGTITTTTYYRLRVICSGGPTTAYSNIVTIAINQPVIITEHPVSQTICTGLPVTFSVVASNAFSYQWQKDAVNIPGATSASYTISSVALGDAGSYRVMVNGAAPCGSDPSNAAVLTVQQSVEISGQPASQSICAGGNVTFTVTATGAGISYQWRKGGINIPGATATSYTITGVTAINAGVYDVVINGTCGPVTSATATLTVNTTGSWIGVTSTDWNTASNWCGGIPTATTDVIIPSSAPNMPNLSGGTGAARTITINTGGSLIVGAGGTLDIYGDLINNGTFNASAGNLAFRGANSQSIAAFTTIQATMNGAGGIVLTGNATVTGTLTLTNGNITLGSNNISLAASSTGSSSSHIITNGSGNVIVLNLASSTTRTVPVGINASSYNPVILAANQGHATDNFTVNVKQGVFVNGISGTTYSDNVVDRTWNINEGTPGGSNVNITFQWAGIHELSAFQRNRSFVIRHNGSTWIPGPATGAGGTDPYVQTLGGVTAFSPFAIRSEPIPRPITGIYPNPARAELNVVLELTADTPIWFSVYDSKGSLVMRKKVDVLSGISRTTLNVDHLSSGVYMLKLSTAANPEFFVQRFVKGL